MSVRPIVMWAGSKRNVICKLRELVPDTFRAYHEPFAGAANLFVSLQLRGKRVFLNDSNSGIMAMYAAIASDHQKLSRMLERFDDKIRKAEAQGGHDAGKQLYESARASYNAEKRKATPRVIFLATFFIIVCTLSFCSIYRENSHGDMTSPYKARSSPFLLVGKTQRINDMHQYLASNDVTMSCGDFDIVLRQARKGDFVYLDPPYWSSNANIQYHRNGFTMDDQLRLADVFKKLDRRGCQVMLSNSCEPAIRELYAGYHQKRLLVRRSTHQAKPKNVYELLVTNYERA